MSATAAPAATAPSAPVAAPVPAAEAPAAAPSVKASAKQSRQLAIKEAIAAMAPDEAPDTEAPAPAMAKAPEAKIEAAPVAPKEAEPTTGKAKAWADVLAEQRRVREEREKIKAERTELASQVEAAKLLKDDPVAFATKYGGTDFGKKWVQKTISDGKPTAEEAIEIARAAKKELDDYRQQNEAREKEADGRRRLSDYVGSHVKHIAEDKESSLLKGWYEDAEIPVVVESMAEKHYTATHDVLTPPDLSGRVVKELKMRLERLSKTEAGQQYLRQLLGDPASSSGQQKTKAPATAPKTLSQDLTAHASGQPPKGRKDRKSLLEDAMRLIPQE